jgi:hypothetical protein
MQLYNYLVFFIQLEVKKRVLAYDKQALFLKNVKFDS